MAGSTVGFSDHSGWAVMAIVSGTPKSPVFVERRRIVLCPPGLPRQAYHAVAEHGAPRSVVESVMSSAVELASEVFREAIERHTGLSTAAVAMGRTPVPRDIDRILASHALLHSAEGELYRDALGEAAGAFGLRVVRFMNKEARSEAAAALGWPLTELEARLAEFGQQAGRPWTKDEKDATAAAMLALAVTSAT